MTPAEAPPIIDWPKLLIGRPTPPKGWWVDLAIQRKVSTIELRASAVVAMLAQPLRLDPGRPPYLAQLPRLAGEWIGLCRQREEFIALGPNSDAMRTALTVLMTAQACCYAMDEGPSPGWHQPRHYGAPEYNPAANPLVPELWDFYGEAAALIRALEAAGISRASRHNRLSPGALAALQQEVAEIDARRGGAPPGPLDPTAAPATPARRQRAKTAKPLAAAAANLAAWLE